MVDGVTSSNGILSFPDILLDSSVEQSCFIRFHLMPN